MTVPATYCNAARAVVAANAARVSAASQANACLDAIMGTSLDLTGSREPRAMVWFATSLMIKWHRGPSRLKFTFNSDSTTSTWFYHQGVTPGQQTTGLVAGVDYNAIFTTFVNGAAP